MAYASFRCLVDAPYLKVWQSVETFAQNKVRVHDQDLREIIRADPHKGEITLQLDGGQALRGERRFAVREDASSAKLMIECYLHWHASDQDGDRRLHSVLENLVRDLVLEMKKASES